jgi:hypothetical protein
MENNINRLGYYLVGWKKFHNKTLALLESNATGYEVMWDFNDSVYKNIDWTMPIETSLDDLYKRRAQQLRDNYDYLILYYSGGADSGTILHTFLKHNIFLDEIVMQLPEPVRQTFNSNDTSNANYYSEIQYSAIPYLNRNQHRLDPRTKIRYQDFSKPALELLEKDNWFETTPLCTNITISGIARQVTQNQEKDILNLYDKGKTIAQILGIDKPLVYFNGVDYYAYFADTSTYHYVSPVDFNDTELSGGHYKTEFFYWTPDMPEIVVKQAQLVKSNCETNAYAKFMAEKILTTHISEYRSIIHPIIYPQEVTVEFQTEKPSASIIRPMDSWFWNLSSDKVKHNYLSTIDYLGQHINPRHLINQEIQKGLASTLTKFYKL